MAKTQGGIYLPPDFVSFIDRNYERIFEVQEKIKRLYISSKDTLLPHSEAKSFDSSDSDHDVARIISATVIPKSILKQNSESVETVDKHAKDWETEESFESDKEYLSYLSNQFPLVLLSGLKHSGPDSMAVTGIQVKYSARFQQNVRKIKIGPANTSQGLRKIGKLKKLKRENKIDVQKFQNKTKRADPAIPPGFPSTDEIALDIYNRYFVSGKTSKLTLPPLHSSVLTLLGQRSPNKASPRSGLQGAQHPQSSASKHKKLRRHGRRQKSPSQKEPTPPVDPYLHDKAENDASDTSGRADGSDGIPDAAECIPRKSLFELIGENLTKTNQRYFTEMDMLEQRIADMSEKYTKKEIALNTSKIKIKEDFWLMLPRTWSHTSATFSAPGNLQLLKNMSPMEYLQHYVKISEPRKHLYTLVFRRYRTLENPTGTTIQTEVVQRALAEVMGQALEEEIIQDLFESLDIDSMNTEVNEAQFLGICAFSERVYTKYCLEDCNECYTCSKNGGNNKNRCHKNQRNLLEQADFEFLSTKLRDNAVRANLRGIIEKICDS